MEALMHRMEHPAPSRPRGQVHQRLENTGQTRPEGAVPGVVAALCVHGPINQERTPHNGVAVHESPVAAVLAVIAIVAHGEILSRRNDDLIALNIFANLRSEEHTSE